METHKFNAIITKDLDDRIKALIPEYGRTKTQVFIKAIEMLEQSKIESDDNKNRLDKVEDKLDMLTNKIDLLLNIMVREKTK